jgi:hypothetical protein
MPAHKASDVKWRRGKEERAPRDYVVFSMAGRFTHADIVRKIAEILKLRLGPLPHQLSQWTYDCTPANPFGVDGSAGAYLDWITAKHENLYWSFSDGTLCFEVGPRKKRSTCVELAGRLWHEASRGDNGRVSDAQLARITEDIDKRGFKPVNQLEGKDRENLARYNRIHPENAIHTFSEAIRKRSLAVTDPKSDRLRQWRFSPRRAVRRWLSRCGKKWEKAHPGA